VLKLISEHLESALFEAQHMVPPPDGARWLEGYIAAMEDAIEVALAHEEEHDEQG
jgi:hypothetical protein